MTGGLLGVWCNPVLHCAPVIGYDASSPDAAPPSYNRYCTSLTIPLLPTPTLCVYSSNTTSQTNVRSMQTSMAQIVTKLKTDTLHLSSFSLLEWSTPSTCRGRLPFSAKQQYYQSHTHTQTDNTHHTHRHKHAHPDNGYPAATQYSVLLLHFG